MNRDSSSGFFTGLVIGVLAGVVIGFMYAPQSGTETRRQVKEKAESVKDRAASAAGRVRDVVRSKLAQEEEE
jgi:gas vesicle protein